MHLIYVKVNIIYLYLPDRHFDSVARNMVAGNRNVKDNTFNEVQEVSLKSYILLNFYLTSFTRNY